jgi:hypothetical protein
MRDPHLIPPRHARDVRKNLENPWIAPKMPLVQISRFGNSFLINGATNASAKHFQTFPNFSLGVLGDSNGLAAKKVGNAFF